MVELTGLCSGNEDVDNDEDQDQDHDLDLFQDRFQDQDQAATWYLLDYFNEKNKSSFF